MSQDTTPITKWVEISVLADRDAVDDIIGVLGRHCQGGAVVEDFAPELGQPPSVRVTIKGFLPVWDTDTQQKLEIALLLLSRTERISEPKTRTLEPEDWTESWKAFFPPQHLGQHTVVVPTWHEYDPQPGEMIIHLDPGMAFGTGLHATTRLCLIAIENLVEPGACVLDVGTGSGILAISAAHHGAAHIDAIDTDPVCVQVTQENATLNKVDDKIQLSRATLGTPPAGVSLYDGAGYDLLLVNILAEIIIAMADGIAKAIRPQGQFVASGIIEEKADQVVQTLEQAGLVIDEKLTESDWVAFVGHRP